MDDIKELLFKIFSCDNAIGVYSLQRKSVLKTHTADLMGEMMPEVSLKNIKCGGVGESR